MPSLAHAQIYTNIHWRQEHMHPALRQQKCSISSSHFVVSSLSEVPYFIWGKANIPQNGRCTAIKQSTIIPQCVPWFLLMASLLLLVENRVGSVLQCTAKRPKLFLNTRPGQNQAEQRRRAGSTAEALAKPAESPGGRNQSARPSPASRGNQGLSQTPQGSLLINKITAN